jgi:hypothetical protein
VSSSTVHRLKAIKSSWQISGKRRLEDGGRVQDVQRFFDEEPADGEGDNRRDVGRARRCDGSEVVDDEEVRMYATPVPRMPSPITSPIIALGSPVMVAMPSRSVTMVSVKTLRADGLQTANELMSALARQGRAIRRATVEPPSMSSPQVAWPRPTGPGRPAAGHP